MPEPRYRLEIVHVPSTAGEQPFVFLPLDGGHVLWSVAEKLHGGRVSTQAMWKFSSVGIVLLVFLVFSGISNDISRLSGN